MKTVYLLRHAKSSWDDPALADIERPLAPRGREAAPRMGAFMKDEGLIPDAVLCSSAERARQTWGLIAPFLNSPRVHYDANLYMAEPDALLRWLRRLPNDFNSVLIVGHNPGMEELANTLAGNGRKKALKRMRKKYPTGALAVIHFEGDEWASVSEAAGRLDRFVRPRDL